LAVSERGFKAVSAGGLVGLEQSFFLEKQKGGGGEAQDHVGFRASLLGEEPGSYDTRRIADPIDLQTRNRFLDRSLVGR